MTSSESGPDWICFMLTDDEINALAQEHVRTTYPPDCEIIHAEKRSNPDGIYFSANVRTGDPLRGYVGFGGFFVNRASGEIWTFGSGQIRNEGLEYWLNWYGEGWRPGSYRLVVRSVSEPHRFAQLLVEHELTYLVRELADGVVWKTQVAYDKDTVVQRLARLPCTFVMSATQLRALLPTLPKYIGRFDYTYIDDARKFDWRPENNTPDLLGPQWEEPG